ncbi:hypothetical protein DFH09DRAFT_1081083 [Mycena vulgaris]|nr:hypothetical protein DFH09DRAFT_1081083 [Mycena vulgaris]
MHLDHTTSVVTHTRCPRTEMLEDPVQFTMCKEHNPYCNSKGSDKCHHQVFYERRSAKNKTTDCYRYNSKILKARKDDPTDLDAHHGLLWLVQDLVEPLQVYGELCVYTVAEKIVSIVGTTPGPEGQWFVKDALGVYGFDELLHQIQDEPLVMRDFSHVNVSFMKKANSEDGFDYFVNEVELGSNVCLFCSKSNLAEMVFSLITKSPTPQTIPPACKIVI